MSWAEVVSEATSVKIAPIIAGPDDPEPTDPDPIAPGPCSDPPVAAVMELMGYRLGLTPAAEAVAGIQVGVPAMASGPDLASATSLVMVYDLAIPSVVRTGDFTVTMRGCDTPLQIMVELEEPDGSGGALREWTFSQSVLLDGSELRGWGTIVATDGASSTVLNGGWSWSVVGGTALDPASDVGFDVEAATMLNIPVTAASGGEFGVIEIVIGFLGNAVSMLINYVVDLIFFPYEPPTSCSGPSINDGAGESCETADVPCKNTLDEMCLRIDDIPGVSTGFKKCMKGRCGCGGSSFRPVTVVCDFDGGCGPCSSPAGIGCSLAGSQTWFCDDPTNPCRCANITFHEMSHGCGAMDGFTPGTGEADRIGDWFDEDFRTEFPDLAADCGPVCCADP